MLKWGMIMASLAACQPAFEVGGKTSAEVFADIHVRALADGACVGDLAKMDEALAAGALPNARGVENITPLFWATMCENVSGIQALIAHGADPDLASDGFFPISQAAAYRRPDALRALLAGGAIPNPPTPPAGHTPLENALLASMHNGNRENLILLLEAGADVNAPTPVGTVVQSAVASNRYDEAELLMDHGYIGDLTLMRRMAQQSLENQYLFDSLKPRIRLFLERLDREEAARQIAAQ